MHTQNSPLFHQFYLEWIQLYKEGAVRPVTLAKYYLTHQHLKELAPTLTLNLLSRKEYQIILNQFAETHEKQTTLDFHRQLKSAIIDAFNEQLIKQDPTLKIVIKGKEPRPKKVKFLNQFDLQKLISELELTSSLSFDWLLLLIAKTGLRFSEALALTPSDFDFSYQTISITKTWDYKSNNSSFQETKNYSSNRKVSIDWKTNMQFAQLTEQLNPNDLLFVHGKIYNSTINNLLQRRCLKAKVPVISIHGLRHTHASLLLYAGVSIASVAQRLGHSNMTTTQQTYLHIIQELENQDTDKIMRYLSTL